MSVQECIVTKISRTAMLLDNYIFISFDSLMTNKTNNILSVYFKSVIATIAPTVIDMIRSIIPHYDSKVSN